MSHLITPLKTQKMNHRISSARLSTVCTAFLLTLCLNAFAQKTIVWKGGTPGQETNWYCAKNWSTHTVPDAFSDVVIPDVSTTTRALPEIHSGEVEVNRLMIAHNAGLGLGQSARLAILEDLGGVEIDRLRKGRQLFALHEVRR
jgi:hypothetical protein